MSRISKESNKGVLEDSYRIHLPSNGVQKLTEVHCIMTYMRKLRSGENLMQLSREVCGRLLVRVGLVRGKQGDIVIGVINAARWGSIGRRRIWRRWQWGLFLRRLHRQKETSTMRCSVFRAHDGRRSECREIVGIRKVDLRCVSSSMRFDFTYVELVSRKVDLRCVLSSMHFF